MWLIPTHNLNMLTREESPKGWIVIIYGAQGRTTRVLDCLQNSVCTFMFLSDSFDVFNSRRLWGFSGFPVPVVATVTVEGTQETWNNVCMIPLSLPGSLSWYITGMSLALIITRTASFVDGEPPCWQLCDYMPFRYLKQVTTLVHHSVCLSPFPWLTIHKVISFHFLSAHPCKSMGCIIQSTYS